MNEHPPDYIILAAVHLKPKHKKPTQAEVMGQMSELGGFMGSRPQPLPQYLRDMVALAETNKPKAWKGDGR